MPASVLSGGEQQMLAISRALLARPKLMMLDEPSLGLSPLLVERLFDLIRALHADGLAILLVEQNTHMALEVAARGLVMELGRVVHRGTRRRTSTERPPRCRLSGSRVAERSENGRGIMSSIVNRTFASGAGRGGTGRGGTCDGDAFMAQEIVLGLAMVKSGPLKTVGEATETSVDIAVGEINAKGGINGKKIKLIKFDTGSDPKQAATATQKFAQDDNALAIVGPFSSGEAAVAFPVGERLGIVQMPNAASHARPHRQLQLCLAPDGGRGQAVQPAHRHAAQEEHQDRQGRDHLRLGRARLEHLGHAVLPGDLQGQQHRLRRADRLPVQELRRVAAGRPGARSAIPTWWRWPPRPTAPAR